MSKRKIKRIVEVCNDYRKRDGFCFNEEHVEEWISQFSKESREAILEEMIGILEESYISEQMMYDFFDSLINYINENYSNRKIELLNCQSKGHSQEEMVGLFEEYLYKNNITIGNTNGKALWLYLDDCIFTGNTVIRDIKRLNKNHSDIVVAVLGVHLKADYWFDKQIKEVTVLRAKSFKNYKRELAQEIDVIWPSRFESSVLEEYINDIEDKHADDKYPTKDLIFRPSGKIIKDMFSNSNNRMILEREFVINGINLINKAEKPSKSMKPLGYDYTKTLGFGSTIVSFRNCANNCPLVMWYGETNKFFRMFQTSNPLYNWYPLFPRKIND